MINPGNPTGQVLSRKNIEEVIKFAYEHDLLLLADEVYQDNVYDENSTFHSFKKVMVEMGEPYCDHELASFMSCSKGYAGECGLRGGYVEVVNMCPEVKLMFMKMLFAVLCPTVFGQIVIDCIVDPPKKSDPSYPLFEQEKTAVLGSLKVRLTLTLTFDSYCIILKLYSSELKWFTMRSTVSKASVVIESKVLCTLFRRSSCPRKRSKRRNVGNYLRMHSTLSNC